MLSIASAAAVQLSLATKFHHMHDTDSALRSELQITVNTLVQIVGDRYDGDLPGRGARLRPAPPWYHRRNRTRPPPGHTHITSSSKAQRRVRPKLELGTAGQRLVSLYQINLQHSISLLNFVQLFGKCYISIQGQNMIFLVHTGTITVLLEQTRQSN